MMSALAMILMAAMAVPGNGSEKVSGEIVQGLDLSGEWEGVAKGGPEWSTESGNFRLSEGIICYQKTPDELSSFEIVHVHEGEGLLTVRIRASIPYHCIYKWEGNELLICCPIWRSKRPTSFHANNDQRLLILHRVKSHK